PVPRSSPPVGGNTILADFSTAYRSSWTQSGPARRRPLRFSVLHRRWLRLGTRVVVGATVGVVFRTPKGRQFRHSAQLLFVRVEIGCRRRQVSVTEHALN